MNDQSWGPGGPLGTHSKYNAEAMQAFAIGWSGICFQEESRNFY